MAKTLKTLYTLPYHHSPQTTRGKGSPSIYKLIETVVLRRQASKFHLRKQHSDSRKRADVGALKSEQQKSKSKNSFASKRAKSLLPLLIEQGMDEALRWRRSTGCRRNGICLFAFFAVFVAVIILFPFIPFLDTFDRGLT